VFQTWRAIFFFLFEEWGEILGLQMGLGALAELYLAGENQSA
jgi:hypothetical protein